MANVHLIAEDVGEDDFRETELCDNDQPGRAFLRLGSESKGWVHVLLALLIAVQVAVCLETLLSKVYFLFVHAVKRIRVPLNFCRMWAISLLMRFSSNSLTLHARRSAMYCCK